MTIIKKLRQFAAAALMLATPALQAALPYTDGDLILGFRAGGGQGGTSSYAVNIGPASQFIAAAAQTVTIPGSIATDLAVIYGADWHTRGDVFWSISGTQAFASGPFDDSTIFASRAEATAGTQSAPWTRSTYTTQTPISILVQDLGSVGYAAGTTATTPGQTESTNCNVALIQDNTAPNSYASHMPGGANSTAGTSYKAFSNGGKGVENSFQSGALGSVIDLYRIEILPTGTPANPPQPATFLGAFRMSSGGVLSFSPTPAGFGNGPAPAHVALSSATYSVQENGGNAVITINRTGSTAGAASVTFTTAGNTAIAGTDFTAVNTTVNFADGEATQAVNVPVIERVGFQGSRAFSASLSGPAGATLGTTTSAQVTIQDDEIIPSFALSASTLSVSETGGSVSINVVRTGDTNTVSNIYFETIQGTAVEFRDYNPFDTTISFGVGETTKTVVIDIFDAPGFQGSRTVNAVFGTPSVGTFTGPSTAVVTITDNEVAPGGAVAGSYGGLLRGYSASTGGSGFRVIPSGGITLSVTSTGAFSGKVLIAGTSFSVSGSFGGNGVAIFKGGGASLPFALKTKPTATPLGNLTMTIFGDSIAGALTNGADVSVLTADRNVPYDGKTPATTVPATILDATTKGNHTGIVTLNPAISQGLLTPDKYPQGDGVFSFSVSKKGAFKVKGALADGTKFSAASALNKLGKAPLFAQLYKKKEGVFSAELKFDATRADSDALALNALWLRPADAAAKHYPDGWPSGITLDVLAARYREPQKTDTASAFPGLGADNLATGNATLTAADGKLTAPVVNNVNISAKNKVTNAPATDKDFKVSLSAAKGTLKGSFTHTDLTKPKFTGIVFQKGSSKGGYGFFLSTKPKSGPTGESGGITLLAK